MSSNEPSLAYRSRARVVWPSLLGSVLIWLAAISSGRAQEERANSPAKGSSARSPEADDARQARRVDLNSTILCWCKKEKWTRTLEGCFEDCANEQKGLIEQLIAEGRSDQEIRQFMVRRAGTDKVLLQPRGAVTYLTPFAILALAVLLAGWNLKGLRKRSSVPRGPSVREEKRLDPEYDARLEQRLRKLDE